MSRHLEIRQQRLSGLCQRKLLQIKLRRLAKIADGLRHRLTLSRGAGLGVEGDETPSSAGIKTAVSVMEVMCQTNTSNQDVLR